MSDDQVYSFYQEGRSRLQRGNPRGAAEVLELAVEREPAKASLQEALGRAYFGFGRLELALAAFESALRIDPSDDYAHFGVGRCFERKGQLDRAAKHYKLACALADRVEYRDALKRVLHRLET